MRSGPMLGYSEPKEVLLWAQTTRAARVVCATMLGDDARGHAGTFGVRVQ
jgi:hypothetical protein